MFKLEAKTDNAAFETWPAGELARILRSVAAKLERGETEGAVNDGNGQKVGAWSYKAAKA